MPEFSEESKTRLATCRIELQDVMNEAIKYIDIKILEGHRGQEAQHEAFLAGKSKLDWPNGRHNADPSDAVDVMLCPVEWNDRERFCLMAGWILGIARMKGYLLTWGGDWDGDEETKDERFSDMVHFQYEGRAPRT